jgi:hypothetical protein
MSEPLEGVPIRICTIPMLAVMLRRARRETPKTYFIDVSSMLNSVVAICVGHDTTMHE